MGFRHGSNELDSSSPIARSSPVILSEAKDLAADRNRPFAEFTLERSGGLRVTWCDCSNCQGLFFTIEPCLNKIIRTSVGADLSRPAPIYRPSVAVPKSSLKSKVHYREYPAPIRRVLHSLNPASIIWRCSA